MKKIIYVAAILLLLASFGFAQIPKQTAVRSQMLVSTQWLAQNLKNPKVIVIYVGRERKDFEVAHIPGARFLALGDVVTVVNGKPNELPSIEKLQSVFAQLGINNDSRIILYGENFNLFAARVYFTLDYLGFGEQAALLDGGMEKWKLENQATETSSAEIKAGNFTARLNPSVLAVREVVGDISWTITHENAVNYSLIDARPKEEYTGVKAGDGVKRGGHIPGAVSVFWMENNLVSKENPVLRPIGELQKIYENAGATKGKKIVSYCRTGVQASHTYFVAKYLGYDAAMYDGSFLEWSNTENTPVITGEKAK